MTKMILTEVTNFDNYPDGRLRAGPFPHDPEYISRALAKHDLKLGLENAPGICSKTAMGTMISSAGPGVMGYMMGVDDLEAPSSDLESFLDDVVDPGVTFNIEGHHCPDGDTMIKSNLSAWCMNGEIVVTSQRVLERKAEPRVVLHSRGPVSPSRPPHERPGGLYLVG